MSLKSLGLLFADWTLRILFKPLNNTLIMIHMLTSEFDNFFILLQITVANCAKYVLTSWFEFVSFKPPEVFSIQTLFFWHLIGLNKPSENIRQIPACKQIIH
jgi:hypothetical protein